MNGVHRGLLAVTGGRFPRKLLGMASVELRTIGRKTGQPRTTMLTSPIHDDTRVVLVASKGGDDRDPQWYRNLSANPDVEVTIDGTTRKMRARTASPDGEGGAVARHRGRLQGVRRLPEAGRPRHPRRHLRADAGLSGPRSGPPGPGRGAGRYDAANVDGAHGLARR